MTNKTQVLQIINSSDSIALSRVLRNGLNCAPETEILIDQDSPLDSEDSHDKNGSIVKNSKLEGEDPENESRCPLRNFLPDEVKESESKMKLVGSDANENIA